MNREKKIATRVSYGNTLAALGEKKKILLYWMLQLINVMKILR